ncbi:MAG: ribbon-helix-helix protein, CopG family [Chloroflexi bacterium]|nr:ribbon-helix-helix protein, CopG family [Chloroflexota bacterium]
MTCIKITVSLPDSLFHAVESLACSLNLSRSRLVSLALEEFIRRQENQRLLESINAAYADGPDPEEQVLLDAMARSQRELVEGEWEN